MVPDISNDRRSTSNPHIDHMLDGRRELLSLYVKLAKIQPENMDSEDQDLMEEFCQALVDYIAAAHFCLYDRIESGRERRKAVAEFAQKIYPHIEESTRISLEFSERYNSGIEQKDHSNFVLHVSKLGEYLTTRIELEDRLIQCLLPSAPKIA